MFASSRQRWNGYKWGALRAANSVVAPQIAFKTRGRQPSVDLRAGCSEIEDQGKLGSCNACSVTGALEFQLRKNGEKNELSILFHYYNSRRLSRMENDDSGLMSTHAIAGALAFGICEDKLFPYDITKFKNEPSQDCYNSARAFEGVQYARVEGGVEAAKVMLSDGIPLVVGFDIPGGYYDGAAQTGRMPKLGEVPEGNAGGHSMLVVGYDDADKTWLVRNSWGKDWADKGYVRIPYDTFARFVWSDDLWAIGKLEALGDVTRLGGPSVKEAVAQTIASAEDDQRAALAGLRSGLRSELQGDLDAAKKSIRDRLRDGH